MAVVTEAKETRSAQAGKPPYQRTQILLEPAQHAALKEQSEREGRSISEIVREMVQAGVDARAARVQRRLAMLDTIDELRNQIREESGVYRGENPVEMVRRERSEQLERVQRGLE